MTKAELENKDVGWMGFVGLDGLVGLVGRDFVVQPQETDSIELALTTAWSVEEGKYSVLYFLCEKPFLFFCVS